MSKSGLVLWDGAGTEIVNDYVICCLSLCRVRIEYERITARIFIEVKQKVKVKILKLTPILLQEQQRFRATIGYTIPVTVSRTMSQAGSDVEVQSFPYVTVLAAEIFGLNRFVFSRTLSEVSELLNNIFTSIDKSLVSNNIIKFEANNEHIFVASGLYHISFLMYFI